MEGVESAAAASSMQCTCTGGWVCFGCVLTGPADGDPCVTFVDSGERAN